MYGNTTPKIPIRKEKKTRSSGFTLVEIMIVIVIIVLMTQMGNIGSLFRSRERNKVEEVAVKIVAAIDEEKVNALLGKTLNGKIVRKRLIDLDFGNEKNTIKLTTEVNLAETEENTYETSSSITKSWSLAGLDFGAYQCPEATEIEDMNKIQIEFRDDSIRFIPENPSSEVSDHFVLLLKNTNTAHEIHIDRRTGLTYERSSSTKNNDGTWQINCN
ncbi:prepilin-type N-terminal cleavage/methylation domain-containing protein [Candidatus Gracilibacteria bacterium]|nr:prepilin-type N-terminal cleavage/methylation domain-containing protein [Candidatus Gracilibacteria bacterium]